MQSVEMYFNETIEKYDIFRQAATSFFKEVHSLTPEDIYQRCDKLSGLLKDTTENKEQFFTIMEFFGPGVLDTSAIGEFQRTLDKAIHACEALHSELIAYKRNLPFNNE